jgi:enoyl-CoA hydratase/carnithine racemase
MSENPAEPDFVLRQDKDGAAWLTLNRPRSLNALSKGMIEALQRHLDAIERDAAVRVVVLAGAGNAFSAGHDLKEMRAMHDRAALRALFQDCSRMMMTLRWLPQPVIARVHGIATAAGCQLVAMCDLVVASEAARFAVSGINVGLFCSTPGVALSRQVGRKPALEMLFTGEFIDARTALARGLVNRVVPAAALDEEVGRLVGSIAAKSPAAVASGKRLFYEQAEMGIEEAYERAADVQAGDMMKPDAAEGIDAFLQKRPPRWQGR